MLFVAETLEECPQAVPYPNAIEMYAVRRSSFLTRSTRSGFLTGEKLVEQLLSVSKGNS